MIPIFVQSANNAQLCQFMNKRLWEYRKSSDLNHTQLVYTWNAGIFQLMCADDSGNLLLHIIEEAEHMPDPLNYTPGAKHASIKCMQIHRPFALFPKGFMQTMIPGNQQEQQIVAINDALYLTWQKTDEESIHAALPCIQISAENAIGKEYYLFCWTLNEICAYFFYKNGQCELANAYPVNSESELLYYAMAIAKKGGADVRKIHIQVLGDKIDALLQAFTRYAAHVSALQMELPYQAGEYPPFASVSHLLYHYLTCELPAVR
jgi:hypothetical protein